MKKVLILLIGISVISCNSSQKGSNEKDMKPTTVTEKNENFDWLLGEWKRLNEGEGKETFENWSKVSKTEYSGIGFTMQKGDTITKEQIKLIKTSGKWNLIVKVNEEAQSVKFKGTRFTENEFVCENTENDFPNKIKYWKNGVKLNATVSGGDMKIEFEFEKLDK